MHSPDIEIEIQVDTEEWVVIYVNVDDDGEVVGVAHCTDADGLEMDEIDCARFWRAHKEAIVAEYQDVCQLHAEMDHADRMTRRAESGWCQ